MASVLPLNKTSNKDDDNDEQQQQLEAWDTIKKKLDKLRVYSYLSRSSIRQIGMIYNLANDIIVNAKKKQCNKHDWNIAKKAMENVINDDMDALRVGRWLDVAFDSYKIIVKWCPDDKQVHHHPTKMEIAALATDPCIHLLKRRTSRCCSSSSSSSSSSTQLHYHPPLHPPPHSPPPPPPPPLPPHLPSFPQQLIPG